jgi:hypothetical protein
MGGETEENKKILNYHHTDVPTSKKPQLSSSNIQSTDVKKISAASVQIETSKINSNVNENTIKPIGENVKNFNNEIRKLDIKEKGEMSKDDLNNPLNPKRYEIFLKLLRPVITAAISDYFALGKLNNKSYFNVAQNLFSQDATDETGKL